MGSSTLKISAIEDRRSIRKYTTEPISTSDIENILYAASAAPSAKNRQPWKFFVYQGKSKENLLNAYESGIVRERDGASILPESRFGIPDAFNTLRVMQEAPVVIIVMNTNGNSPYLPITTDKRISEICDSLSIGAAIENMILEATDRGLGTLWIANTCFAYPEMVEAIGAEGQLIGAVAVGHPAEKPAGRPRKSLKDIIEFRG